MDPVLKVKAEMHGPKNVLKLRNNLSYSRTRKETDSTAREVDVTGTYSCELVRNHELLHPATRQMSTLSESQIFSCRLAEFLFSE